MLKSAVCFSSVEEKQHLLLMCDYADSSLHKLKSLKVISFILGFPFKFSSSVEVPFLLGYCCIYKFFLPIFTWKVSAGFVFF